jgi:hypothetical protein
MKSASLGALFFVVLLLSLKFQDLGFKQATTQHFTLPGRQY